MYYRKLAAISAAGCLMAAMAGTAGASHSWNNYHWARTANPVDLKTVDSVTSEWQYSFEESLRRWADGEFTFPIDSVDESGRTRKQCKMVTGQMRVCNDAYGRNGWLGLATIGLDSNGHIDQGTAQMNDSYSSYWTPEERNHVMCQEIGHVLGLGHTSEDGSSQQTCMDYSTDPNSQWPNQHDYQMLADIYSHVDSYNSYDDSSSDGGDGGGNDKPCNAPPGKGCNKSGAGANAPAPLGILVHQNDHHQVWVANRPGGGYWVHHIRLAPHNGNAH